MKPESVNLDVCAYSIDGFPLQRYTEISEKDNDTASKPRSPWKQLLPRVLLFVGIGVVCLLGTLALAKKVLSIDLPHTLGDLKSTALRLEHMAKATWSGYAAVGSVFAVLYLWQQAFSIPGSVLLNLLAGYLYGVFIGTLGTSLLTAAGSTLAYGLAYLVCEPFFELEWVSRRTNAIKQQMNREQEGGLFWWLLFARLFPLSPYWFINMIAPFLQVPVITFFCSTFVGSLPYNFVCAQAGIFLAQLRSTADILSTSMLLKLLGISLVSLLPILWKEKLRRAAGSYVGLPVLGKESVPDVLPIWSEKTPPAHEKDPLVDV